MYEIKASVSNWLRDCELVYYYSYTCVLSAKSAGDLNKLDEFDL